jgi:hypothetical protein
LGAVITGAGAAGVAAAAAMVGAVATGVAAAAVLTVVTGEATGPGFCATATAGADLAAGAVARCARTAPNTARHTTIASAHAAAANRMSVSQRYVTTDEILPGRH